VADRSLSRRPPAAVVATFPLAGLIAAASLAGIFVRSTYASETADWAAQGIGQDWFDLMFAVPWLTVTAALSLRGSERARLLLAGGIAYAFYELVIYAFAIHFNAMFLVYCAALGFSFFSLLGIGWLIVRKPPSIPSPPDRDREMAGALLILIATLFSMAWLGEIIPALAKSVVPPAIVDAGLPTNPVYVMDLSVVLPVHFIAGVALLRRKSSGFVLAPVVLAFDVMMALSLAVMMLVMRLRGAEASVPVAAGMALVSGASAVMLERVLRRPRLAIERSLERGRAR